MRKIIYIPPEGSNYTGMLSGIYYVEGKQVSEKEFRLHIVEGSLKKAEETRSGEAIS